MSHYFTNDESLKHQIRTFQYTFHGQTLTFQSDLGVFAKDRVDFGTHVLLEHLPAFNDEAILDIGCGVGVVGLLIAKAYPHTKIVCSDVNRRALELTEINRDFNKIKQVTIIESDLYQSIPQTFDAIITNPPIRAGKKVVHVIFEEGKNHLNPGGSIIAVVQKKQGALSLQEKMMEVFSNVTILGKESGYYVFMSRKEDHDEKQ